VLDAGGGDELDERGVGSAFAAGGGVQSAERDAVATAGGCVVEQPSVPNVRAASGGDHGSQQQDARGVDTPTVQVAT